MKRVLIIIFILLVYVIRAEQLDHKISKQMLKPVKSGRSKPLRSKIPLNNSNTVIDESDLIQYAERIFTSHNEGNDPNMQNTMGDRRQPAIIRNFEGVPCLNQTSNPDTEGDVGPDHYFQMVKRSFAIWNKEGDLLYGPAENKTLWDDLTGPWNDMTYTDPIVLYDHISDRWLASCMVFDIPDSYYEVIAVSATPDPLDSWFCYAFEFENMPDYPKFGVWPDGYYMTINEFYVTPNYQGIWEGLSVMVFNRDDMISGNPEPAAILFDFEPSGEDAYLDPSCFLPADLDGELPAIQTPNYLACIKDDAWGFAEDQIWLWECSVDWADTSNCFLTEVSILPTDPFDTNSSNFAYIPQPDNANLLESLGDRLMHRLQYRNFEEYEVMVATQTIKIDSHDRSGKRWYELRNYGNGWYIHQQGTYAPDNDYRWMGSIAMDKNGNIALGYSVSSTSTYPAVRFTGRRFNDPPGLMTIEEQEIIAGSGCQISNPRWGDYSSMSVDPVDDLTFWYTQQYIPISGTFTWHTRIASFILNIDLAVTPDTLVFDTFEECMTGKEFSLKNDSYEDITITDIELEGSLGDAVWFIDPWTITLPYTVECGDSLNLRVRVDLPVNQFSDDYLVDTLFVVTEDRSYYVSINLNDSLIVSAENADLMSQFDSSIYPNPFNPQTTISFSIQTESKVLLEIFNIKGQKIITLIEAELDHGNHSISWDSKDGSGRPVSSGIYIYNLRINDNEAVTKKCLLLK